MRPHDRFGCEVSFTHYFYKPQPLAFSPIDFNQEPYQMGVFENIVRRSRPLKLTFELAMEYGPQGKFPSARLSLKQSSKGYEPVIDRFSINIDAYQITCKYDQAYAGEPTGSSDKTETDFQSDRIPLKVSKSGQEFVIHIQDEGYGFRGSLLRITQELMYGNVNEEEMSAAGKELRELIEKRRKEFNCLFSYSRQFIPFEVVSSAPVRSKPRRTYDLSTGQPTPEGSEIPMTLMNLNISDSKRWETLKRSLTVFGQASGLFSDIDIKKLGGAKGAPFQLQFSIRNTAKNNLIDVGYGVSQILPVLVQILNKEHGACFLLQQPEVHLHPKGQAELCSLLVDTIDGQGHSFVIETHSDYIIDRARIEIRKGSIRPEAVSFIYFEAKGNRVQPHNTGFDPQGNLINAPDNYREFFLRESNKLLGFD